MKDNAWIKKEPTKLEDGTTWYGPHPKQQRFLFQTHTREVFYGGSGGGGKSQSLWYGALQYVDVPRYAALILRRTYADLSLPGALMDRSQEYLATLKVDGRKAEWLDRTKTWTFPSGATVTFGYLENERDKYRYAGPEFQYIAYDELTHFTETQFTFLFTRLRRLTNMDVPLRMRSASNPGGVGHDWVKKRYVAPATRPRNVVFIPARLRDNPSIHERDYVQSLASTDPLTRQQILDGDWDAVEQGRFKRIWLRHYCRHGTTFVLGPTPGNHRYVTQEQIRDRFLTVDPAATIKQTAGHDPDYTVISAWNYGDGQLFWVGCVVTRLEVPEIPQLIGHQYRLHRANKVYFRSPGMEKAVVQLCQRHREPTMNVVNLDASGDKLQKAADALNMAEAGRLWLPAPGVQAGFPCEDVEANLLRFTGDDSGHDDIWDTFGTAGAVVEMNMVGAGAVPRLIPN